MKILESYLQYLCEKHSRDSDADEMEEKGVEAVHQYRELKGMKKKFFPKVKVKKILKKVMKKL
jgi:helix-turn-helix protein